MWKLKLPMKIKIFLWEVIHDRLPTREQILLRRGNTAGKCATCGELESLEHLFFLCPIANFVWILVSEALDWPAVPRSLLKVLSLAKQDGGDRFEAVWFGTACVLWSLWNIRNNLIFEGKILKKTTDAFFVVCSYIQSWRPLWSERLQKVFEWAVRR